MKNEVNQGLKGAFLIHALVALLIGVGLLAIPETVGGWLDWEMSDPAYRIIGVVDIALGVTSVMAFMAAQWIEVRIKVVLELVWTLGAALVTTWAVMTDVVPVAGWLFVGVFGLFFVVFAYYIVIEQREEQAILHPSH